MDYLKRATGDYVTTANLNMRTNAGVNNNLVSTTPKGTKVEITRTIRIGNETWGYGTVNGRSGWMSMNYLRGE